MGCSDIVRTSHCWAGEEEEEANKRDTEEKEAVAVLELTGV